MLRRLGIVCALALMGACAQQTPAPMTQDQLVARGQYLVTAIGGCNDCHTPMTPQGPDMARTLQGADLIFGLVPGVEIPWAPHAPQIAGLPEGWTDPQFETFLQTGVRPDGSQPLPPMPPFRVNAEDAHAMMAYIKTLPRADAAPAH
jgi:mono/diheme cytochrome c family protein